MLKTIIIKAEARHSFGKRGSVIIQRKSGSFVDSAKKRVKVIKNGESKTI